MQFLFGQLMVETIHLISILTLLVSHGLIDMNQLWDSKYWFYNSDSKSILNGSWIIIYFQKYFQPMIFTFNNCSLSSDEDRDQNLLFTKAIFY